MCAIRYNSEMDSDGKYHQDFYTQHYSQIVNTGAVEKVSNLMHRFIERNHNEGRIFSKVLEVGVGSFEHISFVKHRFDSYIGVDLNKNSESLSEVDPRIEFLQMNAEDLGAFDDEKFDRVIATCLLAHLSNQEKALNEWRRVTKKGGSITIFMPCEPGLMLRIARQLSTAKKSQKMGINHMRQHYKQHRNYYLAMVELVNEVFENDEVKHLRFPFRFLSWNFNLFSKTEIKKI